MPTTVPNTLLDGTIPVADDFMENYQALCDAIDAIQVGGSIMPTGSITSYAGSTAPDGWSFCDGGALSRSGDAALFAVIGTDYGVGDGSTTFNKPDLRGRTVIGVGTGSGLTARTRAATVGTETVLLTTTEMPTHSHGVTDPTHTHAISPNTVGTATFGSGTALGAASSAAANITVGAAGTGISIQNAGSGAAHANMQPSLVLNYIIKH